MEETGNTTWKLDYKAQVTRVRLSTIQDHPGPSGYSDSQPYHQLAKKYTIVQTERDDNANTNKTIHAII